MRKDLTPKQLALADLMSNISERCYYAGWMQNVEYVLWHAVKSGERKYGHDQITQQDINALNGLSQAAHCWIVHDGTLEETAIELSNWEEKFQSDVQIHPELLNG